MNPISISYSRTIPTGSYSNEKLGVEIELDGNDTPEEAFAYAKELIEKIHRENNPGLHITVNQPITPSTHTHSEPEYKTAIQLLKERKDAEIDGYILAIDTVSNLKALGFFETRIKENNDPNNPKHQQLKEAYNKRLKELTQ